jgi:hypothetical protein
MRKAIVPLTYPEAHWQSNAELIASNRIKPFVDNGAHYGHEHPDGNGSPQYSQDPAQQ